MKLENFEEWFAIRPNHRDDGDFPAGRLIFDRDKGIFLEAIWFSKHDDRKSGEIISGQTLTGWLDYQRPATLLQPWIQSVGGFSIGVNTRVLRERRRFVASGILKNFFLENIENKVFTGIIVEHPAVHAWINPNLVKRDWCKSEDDIFRTIAVKVQPSIDRTFILRDGTKAKIVSAVRVSGTTSMKLEDYTIIRVSFESPRNFYEISRLAWRIGAIFEFLIGARVCAPAYHFPTTKKQSWNNEDHEIVAEYWYHPPPRKRVEDPVPDLHRRLTVEARSPVDLEALLGYIVGGSDELIFLADEIQSVEDHDLSITQGYLEILGCLEAFDERTFGSGADGGFQNKMKNLRTLVETHGSEENITFFNRIKGAAPNRFSLLKRLERLHQMWVQDGFRGAPDLKRLRDLRNIIPHGRGLEVSSEVAQEMVHYLCYLTALGRYHVLRVLGFSGDQIGAAFSWQAHRYGMFVPKRLIIQPSGTREGGEPST